MVKAFTLIELSISIVIIGFLLSCVFIGNNMLRSAKLRTILKEQEIYKTAIVNFKNTYNAIAGDMINAQNYLNISTNVSVIGNGNGNGLVDTSAERYLQPQHLQAAGLISGYYNGTSQMIQSQNQPNSWSYVSFNTNIYNIWTANETNILYYSKGISKSNGSISPFDASIIDYKIDDGNATTGYIYAYSSSSSYDCIRTLNGTGSLQNSTYTSNDGNYNISIKSNECELMFGSAKTQN